MECVKLVAHPATGINMYLYEPNEGFFQILDREKSKIKDYNFTNADSIKKMKKNGTFQIISVNLPNTTIRNMETGKDQTGIMTDNNPYRIWYYNTEQRKSYLIFQDCARQPGKYSGLPDPRGYAAGQQYPPPGGQPAQYQTPGLKLQTPHGQQAKYTPNPAYGIPSPALTPAGFAYGAIAAQGLGRVSANVGSAAIKGIGEVASAVNGCQCSPVNVVQGIATVAQAATCFCGGKKNTRKYKSKHNKKTRRRNKKTRKLRRKA
jgi:hypothetical protein